MLISISRNTCSSFKPARYSMAINFLVCKSILCFFTKIHHISYFINDYSLQHASVLVV